MDNYSSSSSASFSWDDLWVAPGATYPMSDAGSPSNLSSSDGGSPLWLSMPLSPIAAAPPMGPAQGLQPLIDYVALSANYPVLCSALGPNQTALSALNQILVLLQQGVQPRNEDIIKLLVLNNPRVKNYGCVFHGCDRHGRGLGDRVDKAIEHVLVKHLGRVYVCPYNEWSASPKWTGADADVLRVL